jgi:SAM-dependent methyltransferase
MQSEFIDPLKYRYQKERIAHWDYVSEQKQQNPRRPGEFYNKLLQHYYKFIIPPGMRILELGCGHGNLLASLKPSLGVGVDFSSEMIKRATKKHPHLIFIQADAHEVEFKEEFDVVIFSDLVNDLWDVQCVFERIRGFSHSGTRLVINFFNNLWRIPLSLVRQMGLGAELLEQNWFAPHDVFNLLKLTGFEVVNRRPTILLPLQVPFLSSLANRYLVNFPPFSWFAMTNMLIARPAPNSEKTPFPEPLSVSVVIPARNESGNIEDIVKRVPKLGDQTELVFVEGHSIDNTYETIQKTIEASSEIKFKLFRQNGEGKGDAVRLGFANAEGQLLIILDADMTMPPEDLPRFVESIVSGKGEFINGVRLVYPMENQSMRFFNILGNKFFSLAFTWLLGQPLKDTLCGTKVLWKRDYQRIADNRSYFGDFDPFGDFDLLFGAAKLNLKIVEMPIRYRSRTYGSTNIDRWRHGLLLIKMVLFAAKRIKFI